MIVCYILSIAVLNLGFGFLVAVYLRQRHEDTAEVPLPLLVSLSGKQAGVALSESPSRPAT